MNQASDYSGITATFTSDGHTYEINKMSTKAWMRFQSEFANQLKGMVTAGTGNLDPEYAYSLLCKLFKFAEVDGFPVDVDAHFGTDSVKTYAGIIGAIEATDPRFFTLMRKMLGSAVAEILARLPLAKSASALMTSKPATKTKQKRPSQ